MVMNNPSRKMEQDHCWHHTMLLLLIHFYVVSASTFISGGRDGKLHWQALTGRNILQAKEDCPINFELQNYTILTSQCKGPPYQVNPCCDALKEFACPFADELYNSTYDCGKSMLSYIYLHGYPRGLFASLCQGTLCPPTPPTASPNDADNGQTLCNPSFELMLTASFVVFLMGF